MTLQQLIEDGVREIAEKAPAVWPRARLEHTVIPWLRSFTARVIQIAKQEERNDILAALPKATDARPDDPNWQEGFNTALDAMRSLMASRSQKSR